MAFDGNETSGSRMAFPIDLNEAAPEAPAPSPRAAFSGVQICSVCRKVLPSGRSSGAVTEEQRKAFKCLQCLLKGGGEGGSGGARRFDINASPPREAAEGEVAAGRRGGKALMPTQIPFSSRHFMTMNHMLDNLPKKSSLVADLGNPGFRSMVREMHSVGNFGVFGNRSSFDGGIQPNFTLAANTSESRYKVYLNILREYIAERNGFLGEGWHVEFSFCGETYKTSPVYIAPDGSRLKSMEDVARHLGLTSSYHQRETEIGIGGTSLIKNGITIHSANKEYPASPMAHNSGERHSIIRGCNTGVAEIGNLDNCSGDIIHSGCPVQFEDFCLISAGKVDPRPSYHNSNQIFPVGYRCSWHDRVTGSLFVCDIADGGSSGPIFKVTRYPCSRQSIPVGTTVLLTKKSGSGKGNNIIGKYDSVAFQAVDDESISVITLLNENSPTCLDVALSNREDEVHKSPDGNQRTESSVDDSVLLHDVEFEVESRSSSIAWEKVSHALLSICREHFKQEGHIRFYCQHNINGISNQNQDHLDSLSRYCHSNRPVDIPQLSQNESMLMATCEKLHTWLNHDRFGLDTDFVQEVIEQLPGVSACLEYKSLNLRKPTEALQTISSGFFLAEHRTIDAFGVSKKSQLQSGGRSDSFKRDLCPAGKPLNSMLPSNLIGDVLQVWELAWRFLDVLGLGEPFSFQKIESELIGPCGGSWPHETLGIEDAFLSRGRMDYEAIGASRGMHTGLLLTKILRSLLKLLVSELLSKVVVYLDAGEFKSRRNRKKDFDGLAALKKTKLDMLPVNELTWHEIARRYILSVLSMDGKLESADAISRESRKVFHCLQGDGGLLCGSLTSLAALQGDAVVLADAMKNIFGSLKNKSEIISICERQSDSHGDHTTEANDDATPEWAQVLEPVRKLPTNVGARIRRCINEALEKNPPEWARKILEHSISKEVYKGNASGPTKRAVVSVLDKVSSENPLPKAEKTEKIRLKTNVTDLISKQCRIVLRRAAAADKDKVFCNLLAKTTLSRNDNDDEGLLGYPAMVSRPLDFRSIDLRLAAGVYDGLQEAFLDDVREVWSNVRTVYSDRSDLVAEADNLSQIFEDLYEKEVQTLVSKIAEASGDNAEREDIFADVTKSLIPRAPWEDGICKTCGMDKDDENVLLCDRCDSEYHSYCLNPPLLKIPAGNWYCPSCVAGHSIPSIAVFGFLENHNRKKRYQGDFMRKFLEQLTRMVKLMDVKEFTEFTVDEKIFFLKFFFDEVLNTAAIHEHLELCASRTTELQQKMKLLTSEMKVLKFKEEMLAVSADKENSSICSGRAEVQSDASSSLPAIEPQLPPSRSNTSANTADALSQHENFAHAQQPRRPDSQNDIAEDNSQKMHLIKGEISEMQRSIASIEKELVKLSLRKDFLGRDSNGRVYWAFHSHGARPWIIANGSLSSQENSSEVFSSIPGSDKWMIYESDREFWELFRWLRDDNVREKELKEALVLFQSNKLKDSDYTQKHALGGEETGGISGKIDPLLADSLASKALKTLEAKFGPCCGTASGNDHQNLDSGAKIFRLFRCQCLEVFWESRGHCFSCHQTFLDEEHLRQHSEGCKPLPSVPKKSKLAEDLSSRKKPITMGFLEDCLGTTGIVHATPSEKERSSLFKHQIGPDSPFKLEEVMARFVVPTSLKGAANEIGLIGSGGHPSILPNGLSYLTDSTLMLHGRTDDANSTKIPSSSRWLHQSNEAPIVNPAKGLHRWSIRAENRPRDGPSLSSTGPDNSLSWLTISHITSESSSRPLVGRASEILRILKINLLDIDAALPEDALRLSRWHQERRCAWRAFVKSARSIYEMVEATLVLEDAINSTFLSSSWWYWSSASTAAKISTLSALSLRIYALDSAIFYEKPLPSGVSEEQNSAGPSSSPVQKTPEADDAENPRTRTRASKRRRDLSG